MGASRGGAVARRSRSRWRPLPLAAEEGTPARVLASSFWYRSNRGLSTRTLLMASTTARATSEPVAREERQHTTDWRLEEATHLPGVPARRQATARRPQRSPPCIAKSPAGRSRTLEVHRRRLLPSLVERATRGPGGYRSSPSMASSTAAE